MQTRAGNENRDKINYFYTHLPLGDHAGGAEGPVGQFKGVRTAKAWVRTTKEEVFKESKYF